MTDDVKTALHDTLRRARETNLSKLDGLSEYDLRRPMTATGTNLLGVVKHLCGIEYVYLGETFGRRLPERVPGDDEELWNSGDMWARSDESSDYILDWYRRACAHADETIQMLDLEATGSVPHWPEGNRTTLGAMIGLMLGEECRHGGHLDVVRELVDGRGGADHEQFGDAEEWRQYVAKLQRAAEVFRS
ncbi:DinB family protein [Kribbella sp. NPDC020789]